MSNKVNRREFVTKALQLTGVAVVAPALINGLVSSTATAKEAAKTSLPMVDPNDSVAKAVKYAAVASKAPESKGNKCATCGFYAKKEMANGKEVGTCVIFSGKLVPAEGWCASWNKKA